MVKKNILQGLVKRHPDGFGFFIPDDREHPDVYIPKHSMKGVMTNDRVTINVAPEPGGQRFRGEVLKIISRGTKIIVGQYFTISHNYGAIVDEAKAWGTDLKIRKEDSKDAKEGELVAAEILIYPGEGEAFVGKVKEVIGDALDPMNDIRRVLMTQNIPYEFSDKTLLEEQRFSEFVDDKDIRGRVDLRNLNFITIDGATAKDFDDAVYVETNNQGFHLWVAIADVSHYVRPGSAIDEDAYERGTSVYFPNYVVPMLPEVLSNGLCSLNPHVPRLALVSEIQMDFTGTFQETKFYEAVIESKARVTYGEAQEVIDGNPIEKLNHVEKDILRASDLAKVLMAKRFREGSLDLEIPETQLELDASGNPVDIQRSERLFSHRLIEELMLAANIAVGKFLEFKNVPGIYRIHEPPNAQAIQILQKYIENFGGKASMEGGKLQKKLTRALQDFEGRPEAQILNILTLRSMSQAKYSSQNVGHFGLGFEAYTHFTSPIRRYPDLIAHRLIKSQVMPNSAYRAMPEDEITTAANMLSACEQRSVKAERQFQGIKKARFMSSRVGKEFEGIISSVAKFGIFVLLREFDIDGLVRSENLSKERLEFDEENLRLIAARSGLSYNIGDIVRIKVVDADPELGQVNFNLVQTAKFTQQAHNAEKSTKGSKKSERENKKRHKEPKEKQAKAKVPSWKDNPREKFAHKEKQQQNKRPAFKSQFSSQSLSDDENSVTDKKKHVDYVEEMLRKLSFRNEKPIDERRHDRRQVDRGRQARSEYKAEEKQDRRNETGLDRKTNRKNSEKRGKNASDSRSVRKARSSQRRRKD